MTITTDIKASKKRMAHRSPMTRVVSDFSRSWIALAGFAGLIVVILIGVFAPFIAPQNPYDLTQIDILDSMLSPGSEGFTGMTYMLGTDQQGRDLLSAIFYGLRISLMVGISSCLLYTSPSPRDS